MASSDAKPFPKRSFVYRVTFPIFDNDGDLVPGAAGLDSEISKDGGTFVDCTNEAVQIATASGMYFLDLTTAEMNADTVAIIVKTTTPDAKTTPIVLYPEEAGDIRVDVTEISGNQVAADRLELDYNGTGYAKTTSTIGTCTTNADMRGTDSAALASVCTEARLAELAAGNIPQDIDTLLARLTAARAGYLDNANVGGLLASQADVTGITQAQRVRVTPPGTMERPDSGSVTYRIWIHVYNEQHTAEDLDSNPTVTAENNAGTDRSSGLGTVTKPGATTGRYYVDYTVANTHAIEAIVFKVDATEGAVTTQYAAATMIVDTTAVDYTAADRADAVAMKASIDELHDNRITSGRAANLDNLDATVSSRSTLDSTAAQAACDAALVAIHLDHLLAVDTPTLPGVTGSILQDLLEDDAGTWRLTANALEQGPTSASTDHEVVKTGTVAASPAPSATSFSSTALSEVTTGFWVNKIVHMTSGLGAGLTARVIAFDAGTDVITLDPALVVVPVAGDTFNILRKHVEAAVLTSTEKAKVVAAARKMVNKRDHDVASGVDQFYDDAGTGVTLTDTPTESGGVITVTPS